MIKYRIYFWENHVDHLERTKVLTGPVELMQKACELIGVEYDLPKMGQWYFTDPDGWRKSKRDFENNKFLVIPLEPPQPTDINDNLEYAPGGIL